MKKKTIWKILLVIGLIPFTIVIIFGLYASINGFTGLCILNCYKEYGIIAFRDSIILYSYVIWPLYVISLILILVSLISIFKLRNK